MLGYFSAGPCSFLSYPGAHSFILGPMGNGEKEYLAELRVAVSSGDFSAYEGIEDIYKPFFISIEDGSLAAFKFLYENRHIKEFEFEESKGWMVEHAILWGRLDILKFLESRGFEIVGGEIDPEEAVLSSNFKMVKYLVEKGMKISPSALAEAIDKPDIFSFLLSRVEDKFSPKMSRIYDELLPDEKVENTKTLFLLGANLFPSLEKKKKKTLSNLEVDSFKYLVSQGEDFAKFYSSTNMTFILKEEGSVSSRSSNTKLKDYLGLTYQQFVERSHKFTRSLYCKELLLKI